MEPRVALAARKIKPNTPYIASAWLRLLTEGNLLHKYPNLPHLIRVGFNAGIPPILSTFAPANSPTIAAHSTEFSAIISKEYARERHIGPFTRSEVEELIGPFQSSPLALTPKPGRESFRMVQNLSFPSKPSNGRTSINSAIDSDLYPCTWGTFSTICLLISRLPPGSQAAVRDIAEAHRTVPITPSQWPGLVLRLPGPDAFNIDTCSCFGLSSSSGNHGKLGDAGADLMRARGIGPLSKWSDDHLFIRIRREYIAQYNTLRRGWNAGILQNGGRIHSGGRYWYCGDTMPDDRPEEFDEDTSFPIRDLSGASPRSISDMAFSYGMADIDSLSQVLGIPWEASKDVPFGSLVPFIGFAWDLELRSVSVPPKKKEKYLAAIALWEKEPTHVLNDVQKLFGKLLHVSLIVPMGRAYLANLEAMLGVFRDSPFKPRTPPHGTADDLLWWTHRLSQPDVSCPIPSPLPVIDSKAYSDASSGFGIAVTIGSLWRAWRLLPGWKRDNRDIGWAEAIGFEFLVRYIIARNPAGTHLKAFGDNSGVVQGWWRGRSRNSQINNVFKRIHSTLAASACVIHTRFIPSKCNPADGPSRGIYPSPALLLPLLDIPAELSPFIIDFDSPLSGSEYHSPLHIAPAPFKTKSSYDAAAFRPLPDPSIPFALEQQATDWSKDGEAS
jgi:hypothetical protein